jgi:hypothetical protein
MSSGGRKVSYRKKKKVGGNKTYQRTQEASHRGWLFSGWRQSSAQTGGRGAPPRAGSIGRRVSGQREFHGARPLGARGESRVSGPRQWGQVNRASEWVVFRSGFGLLVAESSCLAC